jgi:Endoplasmic reticulum vesicle transporter/Endoplasmic Reticulum-Golgi Intermediate Compartment (ERGIC)
LTFYRRNCALFDLCVILLTITHCDRSRPRFVFIAVCTPRKAIREREREREKLVTMVALRNLDAFSKTRPDLKQHSAAGGAITILAGSTAALLFLGQLFLYIIGDETHSLRLSKSIPVPLIPLEQSTLYQRKMKHQGKFDLKLHVTFPHCSCEKLDVVHDGSSLQSGELEKIHGKHTLSFRKPTNGEMIKALGTGFARGGVQGEGCTISGQLKPPVVAGVLAINLNRHAWATATTTLSIGLGGYPSEQMKAAMAHYNVSHYIHDIQFGTQFSHQKHKPLQDVRHMIDNDFYGIAVAQTQVKLVPTVKAGLLTDDFAYQTSVVDITIQPQTLVAQGAQQLPGFSLSYDFTPLTVLHSDGRDNFFLFLSSIISIVGGVFVTVGMLTGCLVHSAQAVAKKVD